MLSRVGIVCFAASYAVALALEVTRLFFRSGVRGAVMLGFGAAGLLAHTIYLYYQAIRVAGSPLSSQRDWCLIAAWVLAAIYLYLTCCHPRAGFGVFILPFVLGLIGVATFLADPAPLPQEPTLKKVWGIIHSTSIVLATAAILVGFVAGLMYLGQAYRLKHKLPPVRGLRLPSLEWLRQTNGRVVGIALWMLGVGMLSGLVLNLYNYGPQGRRVSWHDPVVLSTAVMFGWLALCAGIGLFYKPAREGHRVAFLTMLSLVFLALALGAVLFAKTQHAGPRHERNVQGSGFRVQGPGARGRGPGIGDRGSGPAETLSRPGETRPRCARRQPSLNDGSRTVALEAGPPAYGRVLSGASECKHPPDQRRPWPAPRCLLRIAFCPLPGVYWLLSIASCRWPGRALS